MQRGEIYFVRMCERDATIQPQIRAEQKVETIDVAFTDFDGLAGSIAGTSGIPIGCEHISARGNGTNLKSPCVPIHGSFHPAEFCHKPWIARCQRYLDIAVKPCACGKSDPAAHS